MTNDPTNDALSVDANGCLTERVVMNGVEVVVHYDDVPESDITTVDGIRCTTALRTVIDLAPTLERTALEEMVQDCLDRMLFSRLEAVMRISEPDMLDRPGATLLRQIVRAGA